MSKDQLVDWTKRDRNPEDFETVESNLKHLVSIRKQIPKNNYDYYLTSEVRGKSVLDIGIVEHTAHRMNAPEWKHNIILENASKSLGIDIIEDLVEELKSKGINAIVCDATSDTDLSEKFEVIHIGDVIEHVDNAVNLLKFAKRHLEPGGKIIVRTPNPHCFYYYNKIKKYGTDFSNLEHVSYVVPVHTLELARRSGLKLNQYLTLYPRPFSRHGMRQIVSNITRWRPLHIFSEIYSTPEIYTTIYVYEFTHA